MMEDRSIIFKSAGRIQLFANSSMRIPLGSSTQTLGCIRQREDILCGDHSKNAISRDFDTIPYGAGRNECWLNKNRTESRFSLWSSAASYLFGI